jgi:flagellar basal-body rod protein FlgB
LEDSSESVESVRPQVSLEVEESIGQDKNTVDMDREMAALSKNDLKYSAATLAISKKFALLRYAISDGGEK